MNLWLVPAAIRSKHKFRPLACFYFIFPFDLLFSLPFWSLLVILVGYWGNDVGAWTLPSKMQWVNIGQILPGSNAPNLLVEAFGTQFGCCPDADWMVLYAPRRVMLLLVAGWLLSFVFIFLVPFCPCSFHLFSFSFSFLLFSCFSSFVANTLVSWLAFFCGSIVGIAWRNHLAMCIYLCLVVGDHKGRLYHSLRGIGTDTGYYLVMVDVDGWNTSLLWATHKDYY